MTVATVWWRQVNDDHAVRAQNEIAVTVDVSKRQRDARWARAASRAARRV
jgi:hypothetical protein